MCTMFKGGRPVDQLRLSFVIGRVVAKQLCNLYNITHDVVISKCCTFTSTFTSSTFEKYFYSSTFLQSNFTFLLK